LPWLVLLLAVTLAAGATAAVVGYRAYSAEVAPAASGPAKDAVASASDAVTTLLSFRHNTLERELAAEAALMTPAYEQRFALTFSDQAKARLTQQRVSVASTVLAAAPLECGEDCPANRVQVLVFFDKLTTKAGAEPDYTPNRVIVSMQLEGDSWLVDDIATI